MQIQMESKAQMGSRKEKRKRRRPAGPHAPRPRRAAKDASEDLCRHERGWLDRLVENPACFAEVEREVHEHLRQHADRFVAGLLVKASDDPEMAVHVAQTLEEAEVDLGGVEKKDGP